MPRLRSSYDTLPRKFASRDLATPMRASRDTDLLPELQEPARVPPTVYELVNAMDRKDKDYLTPELFGEMYVTPRLEEGL